MPDTKKNALVTIAKDTAKGAAGAVMTTGSIETAPIGAFIGAVKGGLGVVIGAISDYKFAATKSATTRLKQAADADFASKLEPHAEEIGRRMDEVCEDDSEAATALASRLRVVEEAWQRTPDARKARVLMAALVHSFDQEAYDAGNALRMLKLVGQVDYAETRFLRAGFHNDGKFNVKTGEEKGWALAIGTETWEIVQQTDSLRLTHTKRGHYPTLTWLGRELLKYLEPEDSDSDAQQP